MNVTSSYSIITTSRTIFTSSYSVRHDLVMIRARAIARIGDPVAGNDRCRPAPFR